jgi:glycerol uptake facilitator-like aquaporin
MKYARALRVTCIVQIALLVLTLFSTFRTWSDCGFDPQRGVVGQALANALGSLILFFIIMALLTTSTILFIKYKHWLKRQNKPEMDVWAFGLFYAAVALTILFVPLNAGARYIGQSYVKHSCPVPSRYVPGGYLKR